MAPRQYPYNRPLDAVIAFSIQVYTETKQQSGIFLKKMPPATVSKR